MDRALYVAMTGAKHNMFEQAVRSHNLANASTHGFKADLANAMSLPVVKGDGLDTRVYSITGVNHTDLTVGSMIETGRDFDITVAGEGWISLQSPDGKEEVYTKTASLQVDTLGLLRDQRGYLVLGNGGPIAIPDSEKVEIGVDGTISVRALGQGPQALAEVDRIKLVSAEEGDIYKKADGLLYSVNGYEEPDGAVKLRKGFLESSNVNTVTELTSIVSLARQFETQIKLMKTIEENAEASARVLQVQV